MLGQKSKSKKNKSSPKTKPSDYLNKYVGNTPENVKRMKDKFKDDGELYKKFPYLTKGDDKDFHIFYEYIENKHLLDEKKIFPFEDTKSYSFLYWFLDEIHPRNWHSLGSTDHERDKNKFKNGFFLNMSEIIEESDVVKYKNTLGQLINSMPKPPLEERENNKEWNRWKNEYARWKNREYELNPELSRRGNDRSPPIELDDDDDEDDQMNVLQALSVPSNVILKSKPHEVNFGKKLEMDPYPSSSGNKDKGASNKPSIMESPSPGSISSLLPEPSVSNKSRYELPESEKLKFKDLFSDYDKYKNNYFRLYGEFDIINFNRIHGNERKQMSGIDLGNLNGINSNAEGNDLIFKGVNRDISIIRYIGEGNILIVSQSKNGIKVSGDYYFENIVRGGKRSLRKTKRNKGKRRQSKRRS
jgi:hypothetical protein